MKTLDMMYTVEIYRADARTKAGEKLWFKQDFENTSYDEVERMAKNSVDSRERYEIHETTLHVQNEG